MYVKRGAVGGRALDVSELTILEAGKIIIGKEVFGSGQG